MAEYRNENDSQPTKHSSDCIAVDDPGKQELTQAPVEEKDKWKWVVLLGCFMINFIIEGTFSSFGVLYTAFWDYFGGSKSRISLIGSLNFSLPLIGGALASLIAGKFGCRFAAILGSLVASAGIIASVFATSVMHLYISFGVVAGLATSLPYIATVLILSQYFDQRLGFVNGVAECGSCIGTIVLPVTLETLLSEYGWRGTLLIMGGLTLNIVVCGSLFIVKRRVQHNITDETKPVKNDTHNIEHRTTCIGIDNSGFALEEDLNSNKVELDSENIDPSKAERQVTTIERESTVSQTKGNISTVVGLGSCLEPQLISEGHAHEPEEVECRTDSSLLEGRLENSKMIEVGSCLEVLHTAIGEPPAQGLDIHTGEFTVRGSGEDRKDRNKEKSEETMSGDCFEQGNPSVTEQADMSFCMTCFTTLRLGIFKNVHFVTYIMLIFVLYIFIDVPYVYLPDRGIEVGISRQLSTLLLTTVGIMQLVGNLLFGYVGDVKRIDNVFIFGCCMVLSGTSLALVPLTQEFAPLAVCAGAFGFFTATAESMCSVMLVEFLGLNKLGTGYGYTMMVKGVSELIGPPFGGWLYDITGDYDVTFYVAGGSLGICGVVYTIASKVIDSVKRSRKEKQ